MQWSVQGVSAVCSLSLHPEGIGQANQTRLALPRTQRLDLHKSSELPHKCFLWGNPFHGRVSSQRIKERARSWKRYHSWVLQRKNETVQTNTDESFESLNSTQSVYSVFMSCTMSCDTSLDLTRIINNQHC